MGKGEERFKSWHVGMSGFVRIDTARTFCTSRTKAI